MVDNSGAVSEEINVILQKTNNKYIMTITPDKTWLENPDRIYPVTIDPTVTTSSNPSAIFDTHVSLNFPTTVNNAAAKLVVGNNNVTGGSGVNRAYLQFVLPVLTSADMVVDATLNLYSLSNSATQQEIDLYRVNAAWNRTTMNWNNKASYDGTVIHDLEPVKNAGWYAWNITTIAKGWYTSENNYGIMLKSKNENIFGYNEFYSSDIDSSLEVARPFLTISYVSSAGLEDYWTYHAYSAGRAGTAYVNDYNGNLVFIHDDISMNGYRLPISLSHVYNRYQVFESNGNTGYGKGWRLSLAQTIDKINIDGTNYYVYTDGDGTKHYFKYSTGIMHDESGLGLELTDSGIDRYFLKDKGYNEYIFSPKSNSSTYYLWSIKDQNGNEQLLYYNGASTRQIVQVKDGAGRSTYFTYNQTTGLLESIKDPAERITRFGYNGTDLETITYPDGKVTKYEYTASGSMTAAINHDGFKTAIGYDTVRPYRVNSLKETHTDGTLGQETNISYGNHTSINTFTDASGAVTTYFFDNFGRTTSVVDNLGYVSSGVFGDTTSDKNKLTAATQKQQPVMNIAQNPGAENDAANWGTVISGGSTGSTSISTTEKHTGKKSFAVTKTNNMGIHYYQQGLKLQKGHNYAVQAYVKTSNVTSGNNKGASLYVTYVDKDGNWTGQKSKIISGTQDWTRIGVGFAVENDITDVYVKLMLEGETGTAYFDTVQVEQSDLGNAFNMVENGDFAYGASGWVAESSGTGDGIIVDTGVSHPLRLDNNVLKLNGTPTSPKKYTQVIPQDGKAGDVLVLGGWASGDAVYNNNNSVYKLTLEFINTDGTYVFENVFFNKDTNGWQFASGVIIAPKDYIRLKIHLVYHYNGNEVMFDGIHLYKGNETSMAYNDKGNITSSTDPSKVGSSTIEYKDSNSVNDPTLIKDTDNTATRYVYDDKHNLKEAYTKKKDTQADDIKNTYTYDSYGNVISTEISNVNMADINIKSTNEYTTDGNYLKSTKDASNYTTLYNFDLTKGLLDDVTDPNGNKIAYEYEPLTDRIQKVYSVQMPGILNEYKYTGDDLTSISHNGFNYEFNYDKLGNVSDVSVAGQNLITNVYDLRKGLLNSSTYGNGHIKEYFYDGGDRLIEEKSNGESRFIYSYDAKGNLAQVGDRKIGLHIKNVYDFSGKLMNTYDSWGRNSYFDYDKAGKITKIEENLDNSKYITKFEYGDFKNLTKVLFGSNSSVTYDYNENGKSNTIGRLNSILVKAGNADVLTSRFIYQSGAQSSTSGRISQIDNNGKQIDYTYFPNGNIETITENGKIINYYYDAVNQLIREDNQVLGKTITYEYDDGGNLQAKKEYSYTTDEITAEPSDVYNYTYDGIWKDKLTNYNGNDITYDNIGNPLNYNGWSFTWDRGRELSGMVNNTSGQALSFTYNENGIRTSKTVNGVKTTYHLLGNVVTYEKTGNETIHYTYSAGGSLLSMNYKDAEYYYVRNAQGDIIGLLDSNGNEVVRYTYDSWGKLISIKDQNGNDVTNDTTHIGYINPYRYRGYRYDSETGLYYLQSRYYNPDWGRFINADGLIGKTGELLEHNIFNYSLNNPVNRHDPSGFRSVADDGTGAWVYVANNGKVFSYAGNTKRSNNINAGQGIVNNIVVAAKDFAAEKQISNVLKRATVETRIGPKNSVGITVSVSQNAGKGVKFIKGASKVLGVASLGVLTYDIYSDFQNYNGWDAVGAIGFDAIGFGLGVAAGIGFGVLCAPLTAGAAIATGLTIITSTGISLGVSYAKDRLLKED